MVFQVRRKVGLKLFKIKLQKLLMMNNLERENPDSIGTLQCSKKHYISEHFSTNITKERKKLFHTIGYQSGVVMLLSHPQGF